VSGWNLNREVTICSCQKQKKQKLRAHRIIATSKFKDAIGGVFEADNVGIFKIEGSERKCCAKVWKKQM